MLKSLNISYTVRKNKARSNGEVPIYMRLNVDGKISEISVGQTVEKLTGLRVEVGKPTQ